MNDPGRPNARQTAGDSPQSAPQATGGPEPARGATGAAQARLCPQCDGITELDPLARYLTPRTEGDSA